MRKYKCEPANQATSGDQEELLINKSGNGHYTAQASIEYVIRYIARENGSTEDDLICHGAFGATDMTDINTTIRQFECTQLLHNRHGDFGRYIDHEVYSFSQKEEKSICENNIHLEDLARKMAYEFYRDGFQVYYGVHKSDNKNLHIHFATNTVNFRTGKKRHENITETKKRQDRLKQIIADSAMH